MGAALPPRPEGRGFRAEVWVTKPKKKPAARRYAIKVSRPKPKAAPKKAAKVVLRKPSKRVKVEPPDAAAIFNLRKKGLGRGFVTEMEGLHVFKEAEEYLPEYEAFLDGLGYRYWNESRNPAFSLFLK